MKSFVKLIGLPLTVCLCATTVAAATTYVIPQSKSLDARGDRLYVDDAALRAAMPELAGAGERSNTCSNSMMTPPYLWLRFGPTVTGAHVGRVANVRCAFGDKASRLSDDGHLTCDEVKFEPVGFDDDVSHFFRSDMSVETGEARELFHALFAGQVRFAESVKKPDMATLREITISKERGALIVRWGDCGCTFTLRVERRKDDPQKPFMGTNSGGICI